MNTIQAKEIRIEKVLYKMGIHQQKMNGSQVWFLSPFTKERTPSFKIDTIKNRWYCHSSGFGGNTLDFVVKHSRCTVSDALAYLSDFNLVSPFLFQKQNNEQNKVSCNERNIGITEISDLKNYNLKKYLIGRGISSKNWNYLKEVKFTIDAKHLYAIGFENQSKGFELRNSFYKGSILKKDITLIKSPNKSDIILLFEGFMDFLSYAEMNPKFEENILVLNSIALLEKAKLELKGYNEIKVFFDRDNAGFRATKSILETFPNAKDSSQVYSNFKDYNEWFTAYGMEVNQTVSKI